MKPQSEIKNSQSEKTSIGAIMFMLCLGVLSAALYGLLYFYGNDLRHLAEITNAGNKQYFYVPIIIALIFSFAHGAFTGHFWDVLGLKAKQ